MTAQDRVRDSIWMITPDKTDFTALWIGDDVSGAKRLGTFQFPLVDGVTVQDMGLTGYDYPLTIYFDDADHDQTAQKFIAAWSQRGPWTIYHPVLGKKTLQPVKFVAQIRPVENVLHTVIQTTWMETVPQAPSIVDNAGLTNAQALVTNATAAVSAAQQVVQTTLDLVTATSNTISRVAGLITKSVNGLTGYAANIYTQLQSLASGAVIDVLSVGGAIQNLLLTPGLIIGDAASKAKSWGTMVSNFLGILPTSATAADKNSAVILELAVVGATVAMAVDLTIVQPKTREEAVQTIATAQATFDSLTKALDAVQAAYSTQGITAQFFSQSQGYGELQRLIAYVSRYLLGLSTSLPAAKTYTLDRARAPLEIAITEYGDNGWDDSLFDFFLSTNNISGEGIYLLPAGTQVTIYG